MGFTLGLLLTAPLQLHPHQVSHLVLILPPLFLPLVAEGLLLSGIGECSLKLRAM